ncbi:MAG: hypothetical protein M1840_008048 [Geoglossum simile]|nr:MAG: hypothetical protein M1840_008048 [Geoglossum simile]
MEVAFYPYHPLAQNQDLVVRAPSDSDSKIRLEVNDRLIEGYRRHIEGFDGDSENNEPPQLSLRLKVEMGETSKIPRLKIQEEKKQALEWERRM